MAVQDETIARRRPAPKGLHQEGKEGRLHRYRSHGKTIVYGLQTMDLAGACAPSAAGYGRRRLLTFQRVPAEVSEDRNHTRQGAVHTAKVVKQLEGETEGLELKYLPPGCPDLNAMEEKWKQMKRHVLDVPYVTLGNLRKDSMK